MWDELLLEAGLNEREVRSIMILGSRPKMKASELANVQVYDRSDSRDGVMSRLWRWVNSQQGLKRRFSVALATGL